VPTRNQLAVALSIAGSDSGGGAGVQADLKTFARLGVHGTSVITCLTAQNPRVVASIEPCSPQIIRSQINTVFSGFRPKAVKTGMLFSSRIIETVAQSLRAYSPLLVVDPVMVSTSGKRLLDKSAIKLLTRELLPLAILTTPNLPEAEVLLERKLRSIEDMRAAAREIHRRFGCAALVKGGHLKGHKEAADILYDGKEEWLLSAPFVIGLKTHGTGCTYSAAITAHLSKGSSLVQATHHAKEFVTTAIRRSQKAAGHDVLGWTF
jgi:hydroxymethylpyrimidine/phosphomethylpyrimidine kinase